MSTFSAPSQDNNYLEDHIQLICQSFQQVVGKPFPGDSNIESLWPDGEDSLAKAIYYAPFMVVSHNTATDPVFNYGNQTALDLFEMTWDDFTKLPSRQSAERPNQEERSRLLHMVSTQNYITNYSGIRISKTGKRFYIKDVTVWNLMDVQQNYCGQAAVCSQWTYL